MWLCQTKNIGSIADGVWHHVLITRQFSTNTAKMAIDGVVVANTMANGASVPFSATLAKVIIGAYNSDLHSNQNITIGEAWSAP